MSQCSGEEPVNAQLLSLSSAGMRRVLLGRNQNDFTFIIDDIEFPVSSLLAEFLSGRVANFRRLDSTFDAYRLKSHCPKAAFEQFLLLGTGSNVAIPDEHILPLIEVCYELDNDELLSQLMRLGESSDSVGFRTALLLEQLRYSAIEASDTEIDYLAEHFTEIEFEYLAELDIDTISRIMASPSLLLDDEDELYITITALVQRNQSFAQLYEYVLFENLSTECILEFTKESHCFIFENLTDNLWTNICRCLSLCPKSPTTQRYKSQKSSDLDQELSSSSSSDRIHQFLAHINPDWDY